MRTHPVDKLLKQHCYKCFIMLSPVPQTFLTNPSNLRIYLCKIPTVITESSIGHRIKIHIEGPLTSEALKFLSSRMLHYACWPPFS